MKRIRLAEAQNWRCAYCFIVFRGVGSVTVDHVIPRSYGGTDAWANSVAACKCCNGDKSAMEAELFAGLRLAGLEDGTWPEGTRRRRSRWQSAQQAIRARSHAWRDHVAECAKRDTNARWAALLALQKREGL